MSKSMVSCETEISDKNGLPLKELCLIKIYHFHGKTLRGGIGHNYMYKQVFKKQFNGKLHWAAKHLNSKEGDYFIISPKNLILSDTEVVQY